MNPNYISPINQQKRIDILDFLRGFALFGILLVNMHMFNAPLFAHLGDFQLWDDLPNRITRFFTLFFVETKFYPLFALLFGIGFYHFMQKGEENLRPVMFRYRVRLFFLLLFGILHIVFFWYGDILAIYALFGFVLTWFYNCSNRTILIWAGVFILLPLLLFSALIGLIQLSMQIPDVTTEMKQAFAEQQSEQMAFIKEALAVYATGTYAEVMSIRLSEYRTAILGLLMIIPNVISLFLIGLYMGRKGLFTDLPATLKVLKKVLYFALPLGLILSAMYTLTMMQPLSTVPGPGMIAMLTGALIGGPALMLVYLYFLTLLYHKGFFDKISDAVSMAGRMAFTNYLTQTLICTTIFYGYGLGLYGQVNYWQGLLLAVAIFAVQLLWSRWWLQRFRFGPLEWFWRTLTYGKRP